MPPHLVIIRARKLQMGEEELGFFFFFFLLAKGVLKIWRVCEGNFAASSRSISPFRAAPGIPAAPAHCPFSRAVLPCLCSPCPRCTGAASQRASSISSYLSSSHCSLFPYFCKATLHALSKLHFKPTHTSSSVPVLPLTSTYPQLNYSPHIFDPWRLLQNNESSQKWPQENTFS